MDKKPLNPFANEPFAHAVARLSKQVKKKRKLKGGALSFDKRKKATEKVLSVIN